MDRIQFRRDTLANWNSVNPILLEGEIGYVLDNPNYHKMGDGVHTWNQLPFRGFDGTIVHDTGDSENAVMSQKAVTEKLFELGSDVDSNINIRSDIGATKLTYGQTRLKYPIKKGDRFVIEVTNATIGKGIAVGTILEGAQSGFTQLVFQGDNKDHYRCVFTASVDADYFKLYTEGTDTIFSVHKIEYLVKEEVLNQYSLKKIYTETLISNEIYIIPYLLKKEAKILVKVKGLTDGKGMQIGAIKDSKDSGFGQLFFIAENYSADVFDSYAVINNDWNYIKAFTTAENVEIEVYELIPNWEVGLETKSALFESKLKNLNSDITSLESEVNVYSEIVSVNISNNISYVTWDIHRGNKYLIKVANATIGKGVAIGTILDGVESGFSELFLESNEANSYELIVTTSIDADNFKLYSAGTDTKITISEVVSSVKEEIANLNTLTTFVSQSLVANEVSVFPYPIEKGERLILKVNGVVDGAINVGAVVNSSDSGFAQRFFYAENIEDSSREILVEVSENCNYIKAFTTAQNVEIEVYKLLSAIDSLSDQQNKSIVFSNFIVAESEININNSYFEATIEPQKDFYINIDNVPIGSNVIVGSNNGKLAGFIEELVTIENATKTSYQYKVRTNFAAELFKCWASHTGVLVSIYTKKMNLQQFVDSVPEGSTTAGSVGYVVLGKETDGGKENYCVAIGSRTLKDNKGIKNIAIGNDNMCGATEKSHDNTAVGYHASFRNTDGYFNAAFGSESQDDNTTGNNNTSIGFCSLQRNNVGSDNVAVGYFAIDGIYDNRFDADNPKSYNRNVAVGSRSMINAEVNSDDNVAVGYNTLSTKKQYRKCIAIGNNVDCTKDNQMVLGSSDITEMVVMGNKRILFNPDGSVTWEVM